MSYTLHGIQSYKIRIKAWFNDAREIWLFAWEMWLFLIIYVVGLAGLIALLESTPASNHSHSIQEAHVQNAVPGVKAHDLFGTPGIVRPTPVATVATVSHPPMRETGKKEYSVSLFGVPLLSFSERSYEYVRDNGEMP